MWGRDLLLLSKNATLLPSYTRRRFWQTQKQMPGKICWKFNRCFGCFSQKFIFWKQLLRHSTEKQAKLAGKPVLDPSCLFHCGGENKGASPEAALTHFRQVYGFRIGLNKKWGKLLRIMPAWMMDPWKSDREKALPNGRLDSVEYRGQSLRNVGLIGL